MTGGSSKTLRSSETSWIRWESIERSEQTGWGHNQVPKHLAAELKTPIWPDLVLRSKSH